jgi:hypothetical protein
MLQLVATVLLTFQRTNHSGKGQGTDLNQRLHTDV